MVLGRGGGVSAGINPELPCAVKTWGRRGGSEPNRGGGDPGRNPSRPRPTNPGTARAIALDSCYLTTTTHTKRAARSRPRRRAADPRLEPCRADPRFAAGGEAAVVQRRAEVAGLRVRDHGPLVPGHGQVAPH